MPGNIKTGGDFFHRRLSRRRIGKQQLTTAFMWTLRTFLVSILIVLSFTSLRMQMEYASRNTAIENNIQGYIPSATTTLKLPDKINHDEFFHKSPSSSSLREHLEFTPPDWDMDMNKDRLKLYPTWKCEDDVHQNKVMYLHMSRSAGSTFRAFFRAYSKSCQRSLAFVSQCVDLGIESTVGNDLWQNGELSPYAAWDCLLSSANTREGVAIIESKLNGRVSSEFLQENNFDIVAGHLPLGSHAVWTQQPTLYVIMIRHPLARFVSEVLFRYGSEDMSIQELVSLISRATNARLKKNVYRDSYSSYLITPEQMKWADLENIELTLETRITVALNNLFSGNILLGLVERIPESLEMIQYAIDMNHRVDNLFNFFASPTEVSSILKGNNRTQVVISAIENDKALFANLNELLKYELRLYFHAHRLHQYQYRWMQEDKMAITRQDE